MPFLIGRSASVPRPSLIPALVGLLLAFAPAPASAQGFEFYTRGPYRAAVPRPEQLLGAPVGTRQTMYHQQQAVLDALVAAAPDRVRTEVIGTTAEGRVMRVLIISAPENLARLDRIRTDLARLAHPRATTPVEAQAIATGTPVVVLLSHSIHGNEPAGFEASMQTAYQLLASDEPATLAILRDVITIINPSQNPDGHERFAAWSNSVAVASDEPQALEQREPWDIRGRFNHYRFDMNRDFIAQSQEETRALTTLMQRWHPQVVVDLHSTTEQYFFPPWAQPINKNLPAGTKWEDRFGQGNAAAFDAQGWQYYVRDIFDGFYPGYTDLYAALLGATGMTFESDGGPELRLRKEDGSVTTFRAGIAHHYVASMATLATAAASRAERLGDYFDFHASGLAAVARRPFRRVVLDAGSEPERAGELARLLARHGIEVGRTTGPVTLTRARPYRERDGAPRRVTVAAGSYVVDLEQDQSRLATALLEPNAVVDSAFARLQRDRFERNRRRGEHGAREGYEFYDVTAWSLPLAFGLSAYWTDEPIPASPPGAEPASAPMSRARSAYLFANDGSSAVRLALALLAEDFRVGMATRPLRAEGRTWPAGTYVVRVQRNPEALHTRLARLADSLHARVTAVQSAWADSGQTGVGSESVRPLHRPRILLAAGDGVATTVFGGFWYYFEQELGYPVVPVRLADLARIRLADYNVLILPDGSPDAMATAWGDGAGERLRAWVRGGGAVVAVGGAGALLARKEFALTTAGRDSTPPDSSVVHRDTTISPSAQPAPPLVSPTATAGTAPEVIPGSIFRGTLDLSHWLTLGYQDRALPVLLRTDRPLTPSRAGSNPVALVGSGLLLSGFAWPGNTEPLLQGKAWAAVESEGDGAVVIFAEDPLFRAFWRGPARLVTNAVLLGPGR